MTNEFALPDLEWLEKANFDAFIEAPTKNINLYFLYIANNEVIDVSCENVPINDNMTDLLKKRISDYQWHSSKGGKKFFILDDILKYHINLTFADVESHKHEKNQFVDRITDLVTQGKPLIFKDTIPMFADLNAVFVFFKEKTRKLKCKTRKVFKVIPVSTHSRKTKRKQLKPSHS